MIQYIDDIGLDGKIQSVNIRWKRKIYWKIATKKKKTIYVEIDPRLKHITFYVLLNDFKNDNNKNQPIRKKIATDKLSQLNFVP